MASQGAGSLAYAVRSAAVLRLGGELCRSLVGVALVPALFAAADGEWDEDGVGDTPHHLDHLRGACLSLRWSPRR